MIEGSCYSRREVMTNTMRKSLKVNTNHTGESKVDLGRFLVVLGESVADLGSPWKLLQFACNVQGNDRMDDVEIETVFIDADPIQKVFHFQCFFHDAPCSDCFNTQQIHF